MERIDNIVRFFKNRLTDNSEEIGGLRELTTEQAATLKAYQAKLNDFSDIIFDLSNQYGDDVALPQPTEISSNVQTYKRCAWVFAGVYRIAVDLAGLPLRFYKGKPTDPDAEEVLDHEAIRLFNHINPITDPCGYWQHIASYYLLTGAAWAYAEMNALNKPAELWPLRTNRVEIIPSKTEIIKGIKYDLGQGKKIDYPIENLVWLRNFAIDSEFYGMGHIEPLTSTLNSDMFAREYNKNYFKNAGKVGMAFGVDGVLTDEQRVRAEREFAAQHGGYKNAYKTMILEGNWKQLKASPTQSDMAFAEQLWRNTEEVVGVLGVPPALVGILKYANYANMQAQKEIYWQNAIAPLTEKFTSQLNSTFLAKYYPDVWCKFDLTGTPAIPEEDKLKLSKKLTGYVKGGVMTPNEARERSGENLEDHPSPGANELVPVQAGSQQATSLELQKRINQSALKTKLVTWQAKQLWEAHDQKLTGIEKGFDEQLKDFFREQRDRVVKNLNSLKTKQTKIDDEIFNMLEELKLMADALEPAINAIYEANGQATLDGLGLSISFDMEAPGVQEYLRTKYNTLWPNVTNYTVEVLEGILSTASAEGLTVNQIQDLVTEQFGQWIEGAPGSMSRSLRIARTEMNSVVQSSQQIAWEESGVVEQKQWITAGGNVRPEHEAAEAQTVDLNRPFFVGGEALRYPGDPAGSPWNVINCRCDTVAIIKEDI